MHVPKNINTNKVSGASPQMLFFSGLCILDLVLNLGGLGKTLNKNCAANLSVPFVVRMTSVHINNVCKLLSTIEAA